jgi:hypothetical protein
MEGRIGGGWNVSRLAGGEVREVSLVYVFLQHKSASFIRCSVADDDRSGQMRRERNNPHVVRSGTGPKGLPRASRCQLFSGLLQECLLCKVSLYTLLVVDMILLMYACLLDL